MPHRAAQHIYDHVLRAERILLVPHKHPDGDALGSVASFMQFLFNIGKHSHGFCATDISPKLRFLPHIDHITTDETLWDQEDFDTIIVFDTGDMERAGIEPFLKKQKNNPTIINIDHHATNTYFGDLNLVIPTASSTTEILYRFYRQNNIAIDRHIATCLLTGVVTDTDNFTNGATSSAALAIGSDLIKKGGNLNLINGWVFKDKSVNALKLWGTILSRLSHHEKHDIVYTHLTQKDLENHHVSENEAEGVANFMNSIKDGRAGLILKELPNGAYKGSFRTTRDDTDVAKIAKHLGGGGHTKAAGFTLEGELEEVLKKIWQTIEQLSLDIETA